MELKKNPYDLLLTQIILSALNYLIGNVHGHNTYLTWRGKEKYSHNERRLNRIRHGRIKGNFYQLRKEIKEDIAEIKTEIKGKFKEPKNELKNIKENLEKIINKIMRTKKDRKLANRKIRTQISNRNRTDKIHKYKICD